jgi:hypothetical protein
MTTIRHPGSTILHKTNTLTKARIVVELEVHPIARGNTWFGLCRMCGYFDVSSSNIIWILLAKFGNPFMIKD